jgi:hypothetical protein
MDPLDCDFFHDNIEELYGVPVMPIEELPTVCTCGATLTYADDVLFVTFSADGLSSEKTLVRKKSLLPSWEDMVKTVEALRLFAKENNCVVVISDRHVTKYPKLVRQSVLEDGLAGLEGLNVSMYRHREQE